MVANKSIMTNNDKRGGYQQPKLKVACLKNQSVFCQSKGAFPLGDDSTIEKGSDSDWNNNGSW